MSIFRFELNAKVRYRPPAGDSWSAAPYRIIGRTVTEMAHSLGRYETYHLQPWELSGHWAADRPIAGVPVADLRRWQEAAQNNGRAGRRTVKGTR